MTSIISRRGVLLAGAAVVLIALAFLVPSRFASVPVILIALVCPIGMGAMMLGMRQDADTPHSPLPHASAVPRADDLQPPNDYV